MEVLSEEKEARALAAVEPDQEEGEILTLAEEEADREEEKTPPEAAEAEL